LFEQNDKFAAKAISASNGDAGKLKAKLRGLKSGLGEPGMLESERLQIEINRFK
jgi:hypothetical protein